MRINNCSEIETMKKYKKHLLGLLLFITGFAVGTIAMNLIEMRTRPLHRNFMRVMFKVEQEILANQSLKEGNHIQELIHRWNASNATSSKKGFAVFRYDWDGFDNSFLLPFYIDTLVSMDDRSSVDRNGKISEEELTLRGKYAYTLEKLGYKNEAEKEYIKALEMQQKEYDLEVFKKFIRGYINMEADVYNKVNPN